MSLVMAPGRIGLCVAALLAIGVAGAWAGNGRATPVAGEPFVLGTVPQRELEPHEGELMAAAGIGSVRLPLAWAEIESRAGVYDWARTDAAVDRIAGAGLRPLPFLFATPEWAAGIDLRQCDPHECGGYAPASTPTRMAFARFAAAAVERYGPGGEYWRGRPRLPYVPVTAWQVWNEPNLRSYYRPEVDPVGYAQLLRDAAEAIRQEDPAAEILTGGLSGSRTTATRLSTQEFLTRFYGVPGIGESFDGLAVHPYARNASGVFDQLATARQIAAVSDPDVEFWVTELGWASEGDRVWGPVKSLRGQAAMVRRVFGRLIRRASVWNVRGVYWYAWRDTNPAKAVCGWCWAAGLLDENGDPKPAYRVLRRLVR